MAARGIADKYKIVQDSFVTATISVKIFHKQHFKVSRIKQLTAQTNHARIISGRGCINAWSAQ